MAASDYDYGIFALQYYADAAKVSRQQLVADFLKRYSRDDVSYLGKLSKMLKTDIVRDEMRKFVRDAPIPSLGFPTRAEISGILLKAGARQPSKLEIVGAGVAETASDFADFGIGGLKTLAVVGVLALVAYVAIQAGALKYVFKKA